MLRKLKIKFVCINMAFVTVMLCVIFGMILTATKSNLEKQSIQMMKGLAYNSSPVYYPSFAPNEDIRLPFFTLQLDQKGVLLTSSGGFFDLSDKQFLSELAYVSFQSQNSIDTIPEYALRYYRISTPIGQTIVFSDISSELDTMNTLIKNCMVIGVVSFSAFLIISIVLARWAVKPVDKAWEQQKQFTEDASHELKTPLTVILANAELLQSGDCTNEERMDFLSGILVMAQQMKGLVENLLDLARLDAYRAKAEKSAVDFSDLIQDAVLPFEPVLFENALTLNCVVPEGITINANQAAITHLVDILLDNAGKYSYPNTEVTVTLTREAKNTCLLRVENTGDAISKEDLKNIFKRFYRADKVRAMNKSYGLGLSIAEKIVTQHHGKIWAASDQGKNTFYVQFKTVK